MGKEGKGASQTRSILLTLFHGFFLHDYFGVRVLMLIMKIKESNLFSHLSVTPNPITYDYFKDVNLKKIIVRKVGKREVLGRTNHRLSFIRH
jgi:hypothetical protein